MEYRNWRDLSEDELKRVHNALKDKSLYREDVCERFKLSVPGLEALMRKHGWKKAPHARVPLALSQ